MSLPTSLPISMSQVATELGGSLPRSMGDAAVLALAGKTSLPCSMNDLRGGTKIVVNAALISAGLTGYISGVGGSISPGTYLGVTILEIATYSGPILKIRMSGIRAQSFFTSIITPVGNFTSIGAIYSNPGGNTQWDWNSSSMSAGANNFYFHM